MKFPINVKMTGAAALLLTMLITLEACKKDDPDPKGQRLKTLTGTWRLGSVANDQEDVTAQFTGFTLIINKDKTFSTTAGGNPWPASGSFEFKGNDLNAIVRSDDVEVAIVTVNRNALTLSFTQNTVSNGRSLGVTGGFIFSLVK